jgi:hypothetical protein
MSGKGKNRQINSTPALPFRTFAVYTLSGSIHKWDEATEDAVDERAHLYLVEGPSYWHKHKIKQLVPGLPDDFFDWHLHDRLACISNDLSDDRVVLAKWSRVVSMRKEVWQREYNLRTRGSSYIAETDPASSRLDTDHAAYRDIQKPYPSYDPIYTYSVKKPKVPESTPPSSEDEAQQGPRGRAAKEEKDDPERTERPASEPIPIYEWVS